MATRSDASLPTKQLRWADGGPTIHMDLRGYMTSNPLTRLRKEPQRKHIFSANRATRQALVSHAGLGAGRVMVKLRDAGAVPMQSLSGGFALVEGVDLIAPAYSDQDACAKLKAVV